MHPKALIPINAVLVTTTITVLIGLISIGSPTAFNDLLSLTIKRFILLILYSLCFVALAAEYMLD